MPSTSNLTTNANFTSPRHYTLIRHCEERFNVQKTIQRSHHVIWNERATRQSPCSEFEWSGFVTVAKTLLSWSVKGDCFADVTTFDLAKCKLHFKRKLAMTKGYVFGAFFIVPKPSSKVKKNRWMAKV